MATSDENLGRAFDKAIYHFQTKGMTKNASESQRKALYGLSKQAQDGDVPQMKDGARTDRNPQECWKYDARFDYIGMNKRDAMMAFIVEVKKMDQEFTADGIFDTPPPLPPASPPSSENGATAPPAPPAAPAPNTPPDHKTDKAVERSSISRTTVKRVSMTGMTDVEARGAVTRAGDLYKQRDVFKGWQVREFVLQGAFLHYFANANDVVPKKTLDLTGCKIVEGSRTTVGDVALFPFTVSHPTSTQSYNLASTSADETQEWITALQEASILSEASSSSPTQNPPKNARASFSAAAPVLKVGDDEGAGQPVEAATTLLGMPMLHAQRVEKTVAALLRAVSGDPSPQWTKLFDKQNVAVFKASTPSADAPSALCVRGETTLPSSIPEVFGTLLNPATVTMLNPQINLTDKRLLISDNTFVEYVRCNGVWPTAVRDYCNFVHWRLLSTGQVVISSFSPGDSYDDVVPLDAKNVRANLILAGYVLSPTPDGGTVLNYVLQSDLRGNIPRSISSMVASQQPMLVANVMKIINANRSRRGNAPPSASAPTDFASLMYAYQHPEDFGLDPEGKPPAYKSPQFMTTEGTSEAPTTMSDSIESATGMTPPDPTPSTSAPEPPAAVATPAKGKRRGSILEIPSWAEGSLRGGATQNDTSSVATASTSDGSWASKIRAFLGSEEQEGVTLVVLLTLYIPVLAWYVVPTEKRSMAFLIGFFVSARYVFHKHVGNTHGTGGSSGQVRTRASMMGGDLTMSLPVDLPKLSGFLRQYTVRSGQEVSLPSLVIKAAALAISETENGVLNGHYMMGSLYMRRNPTTDVDISIITEVDENSLSTYKVTSAECRDLVGITSEIRNHKADVRKNTALSNSASLDSSRSSSSSSSSSSGSVVRRALRGILPTAPITALDNFIDDLGSRFGLNIPWLGIEAHPKGVCSVLSATASLRDQDSAVQLGFRPDFTLTSAPLHITIGGVRVFTKVDEKGRVSSTPQLDVVVVVNGKAVAFSEARKFCSRFHQYLSDPERLV